MIYTYTIDAETGKDYAKRETDSYSEADRLYDYYVREGWEYVSFRKRIMNSETMRDEFQLIKANH